MSSASRRAAFRDAVAQRHALLMPGAFNAMSARVIEDLGFKAVYLTGAGVTNMSFGLPDLGFVGLSDMAEHAARVRDAVELPLVVDSDTGFGNALIPVLRATGPLGATCSSAYFLPAYSRLQSGCLGPTPAESDP